MGVQMDSVSILLLESCFLYVCAYVSVSEKWRGNRCLHVQECVSLAAGKAGSFQLSPVKPLEREGRGNKRKSHRYSKKEKCIITLGASQWQCQLAKVSRKLS